MFIENLQGQITLVFFFYIFHVNLFFSTKFANRKKKHSSYLKNVKYSITEINNYFNHNHMYTTTLIQLKLVKTLNNKMNSKDILLHVYLYYTLQPSKKYQCYVHK